MGKLKTKNMKESEFINHIERHPVFSESLCKKHGVSVVSLGYSLYVHSNHFFLENGYVSDDIHYDMVKNNLIIMKPTLKRIYKRTRQVDYNDYTFMSGIKEYQDYCMLLTLCCYHWIADVFTVYNHSKGSDIVVDVANDFLQRSIDHFSIEHQNVVDCFYELKISSHHIQRTTISVSKFPQTVKFPSFVILFF
ncbi:hypothetical protein L2I46_23300 [Klebsiella sp. 2019SCSN059]|nr:hypothetical protein [Klebsiella sp. 2019SCSN059]MCF8600604.1 hypothetical protein [Klebsiella sp. 2019SCSN059]